MMGYYNSYGWNSWMLIVMLVWPLLLAAAIWAVIAITRDRRGISSGVAETPLDALRRRFANGDITQQEYLEARGILKNDVSRETQ
ncbi:MAG: SHOCT domain-containing protein [Actinobacteria bacterium]|nr:SHOCT domain-containing protein [Actinomycetota bacterium]MCB8997390.1 SHOCT domain-containing protein [Actinomycetota bacterium]MCB9414178.1 SHOCT domain-containing protein [Actinomycetota bacterium]MCB9423697.1 SHOCT domain-containing protein [Actinomycetota bacterium]HRY08842.1 SHOCT domain-containing protein [Candidatus Nanopelagicales bacterium]